MHSGFTLEVSWSYFRHRSARLNICRRNNRNGSLASLARGKGIDFKPFHGSWCEISTQLFRPVSLPQFLGQGNRPKMSRVRLSQTPPQARVDRFGHSFGDDPTHLEKRPDIGANRAFLKKQSSSRSNAAEVASPIRRSPSGRSELRSDSDRGVPSRTGSG